MKEFRRALKLLVYSPQFVSSLAGMLLTVSLVGANFLVNKCCDGLYMAFMISIIPFAMVQLFHQINCMKLCRVSPFGKKFQMKWPICFSAMISLATYTISVIFSEALFGSVDKFGIDRCMGVFSSGVILFVMCLYNAIGCKFFAYGLTMLLGALFLVTFWVEFGENTFLYRFICESFVRATFIGYVLVISGIILYTIISKKLYRKDYAKFVYSFMKQYKSA